MRSSRYEGNLQRRYSCFLNNPWQDGEILAEHLRNFIEDTDFAEAYSHILLYARMFEFTGLLGVCAAGRPGHCLLSKNGCHMKTTIWQKGRQTRMIGSEVVILSFSEAKMKCVSQ